MEFSKIIKNVSKINFITIYINLKYLPFRKAILLPIWVSKRCYLLKKSGSIVVKGDITPGMIQIGYGEVGIFDKKNSRAVIDLKGKIIFNGKAHIGHGSKLSVAKGAVLDIGRNFTISAETAIVCHESIKIGNDCLFSWDILIMDTDLHMIMGEDNLVINKPKPISIGDHVWIGCRSLILKGVTIPQGCVIAANTTLTKNQTIANAIIGGNPCRILKENVKWTK